MTAAQGLVQQHDALRSAADAMSTGPRLGELLPGVGRAVGVGRYALGPVIVAIST
ncbi:hypothetical protein GCM10015535_32560 [Streptomyces gelaticus]|uniref:Uncharacterized protein n=1 Tax=Streptomyces gelaticus TaxID=285446 RepID=A0ABQ2VYW3_9ACTN|nr:hypothetical protein [Streptomyces gelaticus]GGV85630.1 hypothetical protein GCM10015535_32560 [Streptomyces gelaticus]